MSLVPRPHPLFILQVMVGGWGLEGDYDITEVDEYHMNDITLSAIKHAVNRIATLVVDDTNELIK